VSDADNSQKSVKLVVFDMDSTLIDAETIDELASVAGAGKIITFVLTLCIKAHQALRVCFLLIEK